MAKVLSVKQPWGYLLCSGIKDIENRTWELPEKYKGERVLIHASGCNKLTLSNLTKEQYNYACEEFQRNGNTPIEPVDRWPRSAIIGSVRFVDCTINHPNIWAEKSVDNCSEKCRAAKCEHFIEWGVYHSITEFRSCKLVGESDEVFTVPKNCPHKMKINTIFNWVAADPILFDKPILNVKGKLGFWNYPADILICPYCKKVCLHDNSDVGVPNWGNPVHECEHCKEMILESEFNMLK